MNNLPNLFPQINHELILPLQSLDDFQLSKKWENEPSKCRYLLAIFFRYYQLSNLGNGNLKYSKLITQNYEQLWLFIFDRLLSQINLGEYNLKVTIQSLIEEFFLEREYINDKTDVVSNIKAEQITNLPLRYFTQKAIEKLYPLERLIIVTKDNFHWEEDVILQYLNQKQTNQITLSELKAYYTQAHSRLINFLPTDIVTVYLNDEI